MDSDIAAALEKVKKSDGYLFGEGGGGEDQQKFKFSTGGEHQDGDGGKPDANTAMNDFIRTAIGGGAE